MNLLAVALFLYALESFFINCNLRLYPNAIIDALIMLLSVFFAFFTETRRKTD